MKSSKEIELVLQARLDASDATSQAEQMGRAIVQQIESAIDNSAIGEKLMAKVMSVFRSNFSQFLSSPDQFGPMPGGSNMHRSNGGLYVPNGFQEGAPGKPSPSSTAAPQNNVHTAATQTQTQEAMASAARQAASGAVGSAFGAQSTYRMGAFSAIADNLGGAYSGELASISTKQAASADSLISRVRAAQTMKRIDKDYNTDQLYTQDEVKSKREEIKGMAAAGANQVGVLSASMERLIKSLDRNSDRKEVLEKMDPKTMSDKDKAEYQKILGHESKLAETMAKKEIAEASIKQAAMDAGTLDQAIPDQAKATPWYQRKGLITGAGAVGVAATVLGQLPGDVRRFRSDYAQINNYGNRSLGDKDYDSVIAMGRMGGQGGVHGQAETEGLLRTTGSVIGRGLGYAGAAAATGLALGSVVPVLGTALGGMAGAALGAGYGVYEGLAGHSGNVRGSMEDQVSKYLSTNKEAMGMYRESSSLARGTYNTSLGMGSDQFSNFMYGGGTGGILDRSKGTGLSYQQLISNQNQYASQMGTVVNGKMNLDDSRVQDAIVNANKLQASGLYNAPEISGAYYRGGTQTTNPARMAETALDRTSSTYKDMMFSGVADEQIPSLMGRMAAEGGRMPGGMDQAEYNLRSTVAGGQRANEVGNSALMNIRADVQGQIMGSMQTGAGQEGIAKAMAVDSLGSDLRKRLGKNFKGFKNADKLALQMGKLDDDGLNRLTNGSLSDEDRKAVLSSYMDSEKKNLSNIRGVVAGDAESGGVLAASGMGIDTYTGLKTGADQANSVGTGLNIGPVAKGTTVATGKAESIVDTTIDVTKTSEGFKMLGQTIGILNDGLPQFIDNFKQLAAAMKGPDSTQYNPLGFKVPMAPPKNAGPKQ